MAQFCVCKAGLNNTGTECPSLQGITTKLIYVPIKANDGTFNSIETTDVLNDAFVTGKINDSDPSKRWYPSPYFDNVEDLAGDTVFETLNSGRNVFVRKGIRTFTGVHVEADSIFLGKIEGNRCGRFGVYFIDEEGSLHGNISSDGNSLLPVPVESDSFDAMLMKATDTTSQKVQITFQFLRTVKDSDLRTIPANEWIDVDLTSIEGLLDVNGEVTNPTTTTFTYTATLDYGYFNNPIKVQGLLIGDFTLFNNTSSSLITITSVNESSEGVHDFVIPAQTASDELTLTPTLEGYSFTTETFTV